MFSRPPPAAAAAAKSKPPESKLALRLQKARQNGGGGCGAAAVEAKKVACICHRPLTKIICRVCAHILEGRVMRKCHAHPNHLYLLDVNACPSCKVNQVWLEEHPFAGDEKPTKKNRRIDDNDAMDTE